MSRRTVTTSDMGVIEIDEDMCPPWCDRGHVEYGRENDGLLPAVAVTEHRGGSGEGSLDELRNYVSGSVFRVGGAHWDVSIAQELQPPYDRGSGYATPELVELHIASHEARNAQMSMTTGEARVLAAQLLALADRVDLAYVGGAR